jgi:REP element-mobilizing transposase RayT
MRSIALQNEHYYHIYNRGVDKRNIFLDNNDYLRFLISLREFNNINPTGGLINYQPLRGHDLLEVKPLITLICYALLPNHYHVLIEQKIDNGISLFMGKLGNSYTQYFNNRYNRSGSLFQGTFKATEIKSDGQLQRTSCYINGNAEIHDITKAKNWPWSSYLDYLNLRKGNLCNKNIILKQFKNTREYEELTNKIINDSKQQKSELKNFLLEK